MEYDTNKLKEALTKLDSLNTNDELAYEEAFLIFLSINKLPIFINKLNAGTRLFRTRTNENSMFENCSDIGLPPRKNIVNYARCNRPFQAIFYCSENRPTSYMELLEYWVETKQIGDRLSVTIGAWEVMTTLNVIIVVTPDKTKRISNYDRIHGSAYDELQSNKDGEAIIYINIFYDYMFDKFRSPAKNDLKTYIITTAYSNLALCTANSQASGISYPSVPFRGDGVNYAILPGFTNSYLKLTNVLWTEFEVRATPDGHHDFMDINRVHTDNFDFEEGKILW